MPSGECTRTRDRLAGGNTGCLFLTFGGPVCADRFSNCPLDRVLTYKNLIYLLNLQFYFSYISWPLQDLNEALFSFLASFEDFPSCRRDKVVGESSCVVPAAFLLLHRSPYLHDSTSI